MKKVAVKVDKIPVDLESFFATTTNYGSTDLRYVQPIVPIDSEHPMDKKEEEIEEEDFDVEMEEEMPTRNPYSIPNPRVKRFDPYSVFKKKVANLYELYLKSSNTIYLYKLIVTNFERYLHNAMSYNPIRPKLDVEERVRRDVNNLMDELVGMNIIPSVDTKGVISRFVEGIYNYSATRKIIHLSLCTSDMCTQVIYHAKKKGVIIDEELINVIKSINFSEFTYEGHSIELTYVASVNVLIFTNIEEDRFQLYRNMGEYIKSLDKLPSIDGSVKEEIVDFIEIDGKKYSKKIFEFITESNYDNFMINLELETLLNNKDIAEEEVVEGKMKIL